MDCEMGNQGEADQFCKADRLDNVGGLGDRDFGAARAVSATTPLLPIRLCCAAVAHKLDK